jgi:hypothetical protein
MTGVLCYLALAQAVNQKPQDPKTTYTEYRLLQPGTNDSRLSVFAFDKRMDPPKRSPKKFGDPPLQWEFDWITGGYGVHPSVNNNLTLRFSIFSQQRASKNDSALDVGKMLMRLWDFSFQSLKMDHSGALNNGIVDVYLCWGGKAGGEQLFDEDYRGGRNIKVNTIYIYDLASFTDPVEKAREIAHEYGHAMLPPVGVFTAPEDWSNGYLGEKLYLRHIRDEMAAGRFGAPDVMGADLPGLDKWVKANVDPIVSSAATNGPANKISAGGKLAMDMYLGLALYVDQIYGHNVLSRAYRFTDMTKPETFLDAVMTAVEEVTNATLNFPKEWAGRTVWVPVSTSSLTGSAILAKKPGWVQVRIAEKPIVIRSVRADQ